MLGEIRMLKICGRITGLLGPACRFGFVWLAFWRFVVGIAVAVIMIGALTIVTRHVRDRLAEARASAAGVGIDITVQNVMPISYGLAAADWDRVARRRCRRCRFLGD